ncbi:hypothetical protein OG836_05940 [Micromonospora zamorensis]|uniref:hypothetical protein n=1 Tax=Micromonospora zamorensis TaxID=709883 RepID=UPI002E22F350
MAWHVWIAPIGTAVVGVAGIAGTLWAAMVGRKTQLALAQMQLEANERNARYADKRALYAKVLHHLQTQIDLANQARHHAEALKGLVEGEGTGSVDLASLQRKVSNLQERLDRTEWHAKALESYGDASYETIRLVMEVRIVVGDEMANAVLTSAGVVAKVRNGLEDSAMPSFMDLAGKMQADLRGGA